VLLGLLTSVIAGVMVAALAMRLAAMPLSMIRGFTLKCGLIMGALAAVVGLALPPFSFALSGTTLTLLGLALTLAMRRLNWATIEAAELEDPRTRQAALERLERRLAELDRSGTHAQQASQLTSLSAALLTTGQPERALTLLQRIPLDEVAPDTAALCRNNLANAHIDLGDAAAARRVIEGARHQPARQALIRDCLTSTEALVLAIEGDHAAADELLASVDPIQAEGILEGSVTLVVAHAKAAAGDLAGAEAALDRLASRPNGQDLLARLSRHHGPASRLARSRLEVHGAYR